MNTILVLLCSIGFFLNALLHLLLVLGLPLGEYVLGGQHKALPYKMRAVSCIFIILWIVVGLSYLNYGEIIYLFSNTFAKTIIRSSSVFLFFAIFSNAFLTNSKKERFVMTPFSLVTFICSLLVLR